jgi:arginyl-tRNA synthetase
VPGTYVCRADDPTLEAELDRDPSIAAVTLSNRFITISLTREALARVAVDVAEAGPRCTTSNALHGRTVPAAATAHLAEARDWAHAHAALAAELTAALAAAAGAALAKPPARDEDETQSNPEIARAIAFAGEDAVRFALARTRPPATRGPDPAIIARHVLGNPAYAVRYAHAAAVAVLRWAGTGPTDAGEFRPRQLAEPGELALLDALSWLSERVATAARRGRPDEFARYLETLASRTIDIMSTTDYKAGPAITAERLWLAVAARTGLAAGLGLLGITAPDRI